MKKIKTVALEGTRARPNRERGARSCGQGGGSGSIVDSAARDNCLASGQRFDRGLQTDLDEWIRSYNEERPHQGHWCFGKTPMQTFLRRHPHCEGKNGRCLTTVSSKRPPPKIN